MAVTAAATVVNAVAVVVLVIVTISYARSAKRQAQAAEQQARSAQAQATAAAATLNELRRQLYEQKNLDRAVVQGAVDSALSNVERWLAPGPRQSLESVIRSHTLPPTTELLPDDVAQVLESARRVSGDLAASLGNVFDALRVAQANIDALRGADRDWYRSEDFSRSVTQISGCLQGARESLQRMRTDIYRIQVAEPNAVLLS